MTARTPGGEIPEAWLVNLSPGTGGARVVCFAHAGGGPSAFRPWTGLLDPAVRLDAVALPGREHRLDEPAPTSLAVSAGHLAEELTSGEPVDVFFGHSMGSLLAFETCRVLRARGAPLPGHVVVSGARPPHMPRATAIHDQPAAALLAELRRLRCTPEEVLRSEEVVEALLPTVRADFTAVETYVYSPQPPLPVRMTALGGADDRDVLPEHLRSWRAHAEEFTGTRQLPGDHFYLNGPARAAVVRTVADVLAEKGGPRHERRQARAAAG